MGCNVTGPNRRGFRRSLLFLLLLHLLGQHLQVQLLLLLCLLLPSVIHRDLLVLFRRHPKNARLLLVLIAPQEIEKPGIRITSRRHGKTVLEWSLLGRNLLQLGMLERRLLECRESLKWHLALHRRLELYLLNRWEQLWRLQRVRHHIIIRH
jgi:hypothetical protein